jgi:hypothetical protein
MSNILCVISIIHKMGEWQAMYALAFSAHSMTRTVVECTVQQVTGRTGPEVIALTSSPHTLTMVVAVLGRALHFVYTYHS